MPSLAGELYLVAHDGRTGRPLGDARATELGLAAALLAELVLAGRITVHNGELTLLDRRPVPDGTVLDQLVAGRHIRMVRIWLALLAGQAVDLVGERLERDGLVTRTVRRWGRPVRYLPVDPAVSERLPRSPLLADLAAALDDPDPVPALLSSLTQIAGGRSRR